MAINMNITKQFFNNRLTSALLHNLIYIIPCFFLSIGSIGAANAAATKPQTTKKDRTSYLFVHTAEKAKIELVNKESKTYKITLKQTSPFVTYFSERPQRIVKTMPMEQFIKLWEKKGNNSFKEDAPNADFNGIQVGFLTPDKPLNIVLQLSQPVYDNKKQTVVYTASPLDGSAATMPETGSFNSVILFIDDACLSCW